MSNTPKSTLIRTEYHFEGQTDFYRGKVRDVYTINDKYLVSIATDRISAFDVILPRPIPYKGQVLNQLAAYFLEQTRNTAPNWYISLPDPNATIGHKCQPFKIELIVRGVLVGHAWREYQKGARQLAGAELPDSLKEYDSLPTPIITPTTKAEAGHDEDISPAEIITQGLATEAQWQELSQLALKLFAKGQTMAQAKKLFLADTKYEFGRLNGQIVLIDEIHTPDSSRYFELDGYNNYVNNRIKEPPKHLSKEFTRAWLLDNGFSGQAGQTVPEMSDEIVEEISARYIELYEKITGQKFVKTNEEDINNRIQTNVKQAIRSLE